MNPTNKDVYTFNSKSLDSAIVSNSWGLFGKRMVTVVDQNNNSQTLKFDYLIKLADEKIVNAKVKGDKEELRDAYEFLDRVIILNKNSKNLTSYFDYSKEGDIEKIQLTNSDKRQEIYQEVSENAKANLQNMIGIDTSEHSDSSLSFVVNMIVAHFPKFKAENKISFFCFN